MSQKSGYLSKQFLTWLFANIIGFGTLGALYFVIPSKILMSGIVASTLIISIPISLAQWIALRRILHKSILWIFTVSVGLSLAILISKVIPDGLWQLVDDESIGALTAGYLVGGFSIGVPQWLILRRQLPRSSIWLLGSSIGAAAGLWFLLVTDLINQSGIISYIVGVLIYSIVTGLTLTGLLAYNNQSQANLTNATYPRVNTDSPSAPSIGAKFARVWSWFTIVSGQPRRAAHAPVMCLNHVAMSK